MEGKRKKSPTKEGRKIEDCQKEKREKLSKWRKAGGSHVYMRWCREAMGVVSGN